MKIDGFWISDYMILADSSKIYIEIPMIIYVEGDSIFAKNMGDPINGYEGGESKTIFKYTKNGIKLNGKELEELLIDVVSKDSMVIDQYRDGTKEVFRRLDPTETAMNWSPSNKSYHWMGNTSSMNTKFIDNGLFVDYTRKTKRISIGQWEIFSLKNRTLLTRNILYPLVFPIDSIKENSVFLSIFDIDEYNYTFEKYQPETPKELFGEWVFVDSEYINGNLPPPSLFPIQQNKIPEFEYFKIELDSIKTIKKGVSKTNKWLLGGDNNLIIFPYLKPTNVTFPNDSIRKKELIVKRNILKIEYLTENELELLADYELTDFNGFERKLRFRKKK